MNKATGRTTKILIFLILILSLLIQSAIFSSPINQIDNEIAISASEIKDFTTEFPVKLDVTKQGVHKAVLKFKLFDLITFKSVKADIVEDEYIYLGGDPIGITLKTDGVIITAKTDVITREGIKSPTRNADIATGDVLLKLDSTRIKCLNDIRAYLKNNKNKVVIATVRRKTKIFETPIEPAVDTISNEKKLGLFVKEEISGVGTLTYIKTDDLSFGALGHNVSDSFSGAESITGNIYKCNILGVAKGGKGSAGELRGYFNRTDTGGKVRKNNAFGIYGTANEEMIEGKEKIVMASRFSAKLGKAEIWTTIDGNKAKKYAVEIIKLNYQKSQAEKGIVLRVTDKELLARTGGIVQGMSGSPIVQDGKLIGAVTHVFLNDPAKGYGIYIDWMKNNNNAA
ncbi:MAG: SpoIVB peptidase [Christensenellales bacterium]|jgi:stage IV sporulation protein B